MRQTVAYAEGLEKFPKAQYVECESRVDDRAGASDSLETPPMKAAYFRKYMITRILYHLPHYG